MFKSPQKLAELTSKYQKGRVEEVDECSFCHIVHLNKELFLETSNFLILVNPYYMIPGHVMVISKSHYGCAGELSPPLFEEFIECKNFVKSALKNHFKIEPIFYEHGRAGACISLHGQSIICEHMHFHLLPINLDITATEDGILNTLKSLKSPTDQLLTEFEKHGPYLFFENEKGGNFYIIDNPDLIPSHYLATLIAKAAEAANRANWQNYAPNYDHANKMFMEIFGENHGT